MPQHVHGLLTSVITSLTFLSGVAVTTQAQAPYYELRCRGSATGVAIDVLNETTLSLKFSASAVAAGATSQGLEPGTCSWIDRPVNVAEPRQVQFGVSASERTSIPQHLNSSNNYWSFFVANSGNGYFQANSHKAWSSSRAIGGGLTNRGNISGIAGRPAAPANPDMITRLPGGAAFMMAAVRDVKVVPENRNVTISFTTYPNTVPLVEIAAAEPVKGPGDRWVFPAMRSATVAEVFKLKVSTVPLEIITRPVGGDKANGNYTVDMNQELFPGTYYYIISARSDNSPNAKRGQATGSFVIPES